MFQKLEGTTQDCYYHTSYGCIIIPHLFQLCDHAQDNHLSHLSRATQQSLNCLELKQMTQRCKNYEKKMSVWKRVRPCKTLPGICFHPLQQPFLSQVEWRFHVDVFSAKKTSVWKQQLRPIYWFFLSPAKFRDLLQDGVALPEEFSFVFGQATQTGSWVCCHIKAERNSRQINYEIKFSYKGNRIKYLDHFESTYGTNFFRSTL